MTFQDFHLILLYHQLAFGSRPSTLQYKSFSPDPLYSSYQMPGEFFILPRQASCIPTVHCKLPPPRLTWWYHPGLDQFLGPTKAWSPYPGLIISCNWQQAHDSTALPSYNHMDPTTGTYGGFLCSLWYPCLAVPNPACTNKNCHTQQDTDHMASHY